LERADADTMLAAQKGVILSFYRLAEHYTFAVAEGDGATLQERKAATVKLTRALDGEKLKLARIGGIATKFFAKDKKQRNGQNGILLAGTVEGVERPGALFSTRLTLDGVGEILTVLSVDKPNVKLGDKVLVLGSIVDMPDEKIQDYDGGDQRVIWARAAGVLAAE